MRTALFLTLVLVGAGIALSATPTAMADKPDSCFEDHDSLECRTDQVICTLKNPQRFLPNCYDFLGP